MRVPTGFDGYAFITLPQLEHFLSIMVFFSSGRFLDQKVRLARRVFSVPVLAALGVARRRDGEPVKPDRGPSDHSARRPRHPPADC
jgi:hypothetical protein